MGPKGLFRDLVRKFLKKFQVWHRAQTGLSAPPRMGGEAALTRDFRSLQASGCLAPNDGAFAGKTPLDYSQPEAGTLTQRVPIPG
jgi:hypothetical protein